MSAITPKSPSMSLWAAVAAIVVAFVIGFVLSRTTGPIAPEVGASSGDGAQATAQALRWRVPNAFAGTLPGLGDNALYVSESVKNASGGAIFLEIFDPGKVVPSLEITNAVRENKIQAGYTWLGYDQGKIPSSALLSAVPFGMDPWEYTAWWYEGEGKALGEELYGKENIHPILCGIIGPETAGWFKNEIKSLGDLEGLKIRFAGLGGKVMQEVGASVTVLSGGEIFQALEKGAIDATEFSMPAIDQRLGFDKIAKYNYFPGWHQTYTAFHFVVNIDVWNGLPPSTQALLDMACTAGVTRNLAKGEAIQGEVIASFSDRGVSAARLPEELLRELQSTTTRVLEQEAAGDVMFKKIYESQKAFSADYKHWKRLAYLPHDF